MDVSTISAALSSFNALKDIAQSMVGLRDAVAFQDKLIEFQGKLIEAQTSVFAVNEERTRLLSRVNELERQIAALEGWQSEKQRYEMKLTASGSIIYSLKVDATPTEPPHNICPSCYQSGRKSILQTMPRTGPSMSLRIPPQYRCSVCKAEIVI
jgi:hypothetical protein